MNALTCSGSLFGLHWMNPKALLTLLLTSPISCLKQLHYCNMIHISKIKRIWLTSLIPEIFMRRFQEVQWLIQHFLLYKDVNPQYKNLKVETLIPASSHHISMALWVRHFTPRYLSMKLLFECMFGFSRANEWGYRVKWSDYDCIIVIRKVCV